MDFKTPPQCECGNGFMVLREAGPHSTRPGHYYFICPAGLKHRNRFFWYDEYEKVSSSNEPSSNIEMGSKSSQNPPSPSLKRRHTEGYTASGSSQSYNLQNADTLDTEQHVRTNSVIASTTSAPSNDPVDHNPLSVEQVCCCFGCICSILCLMMFFILVIVISKNMSVTFHSGSQASVNSKYVVPLISLLSDDEGDGLDHPLAPATGKETGGLVPPLSTKETASTEKPKDLVADMYLKELMKHLTSKKRGWSADTGATKKRAAEEKCVPVVVIDSSSESSW